MISRNALVRLPDGPGTSGTKGGTGGASRVKRLIAALPFDAIRWAAPPGDKQGVEHGANMLAAVGLPALSVAPSRANGEVRLQVLGGEFSEGFSFAWPIWREPASLSSIRALLSHPDLREREAIAHLGVDHVRVSHRISPPGSKYTNFTFAQEIGMR